MEEDLDDILEKEVPPESGSEEEEEVRAKILHIEKSIYVINNKTRKSLFMKNVANTL